MTSANTLRALVCSLVLALCALPVTAATEVVEETSGTPVEAAQSPDSAEDTAVSDGGEQRSACEEQGEEVEDGPACHGILTCTFYVAGKILVFPFRLLGGLLSIII